LLLKLKFPQKRRKLMIAIIQRVSKSTVSVDGKIVGQIDRGFNILLGVLKDDSVEDIEKLVKKIVNLRCFSDECGKMNLSILDVDGEALIVSQFTLGANIKKGNRPSFTNAMPPKEAKELYLKFIDRLKEYIKVESGIFGANMEVKIINDGPVTFVLNSKEL